jgi:outer membrane receptor protein involved in Fe transport
MVSLLPPVLILLLNLAAEAPDACVQNFDWSVEDPVRHDDQTPAFEDSVTVTAARVAARVGDTPASVAAVTPADLELASTTAIDAVLRQVPGFTLFRRSDSRTANPTTQGASLRGVGGSGASRALVLDDGVPLNDPFGGWISWGRIVGASLERVEVVRGGSSDLYGAPALSGVIQMVPRAAKPAALAAEASYGSAGTADGEVFAAGELDAWAARVSAAAFRTDGYVLLSPEEAGLVDVAAHSRYAVADAALERSVSSGRVFLRGSYFDEERGNGTPLQVNDTSLWQASAGIDGVSGDGAYVIRAYGLRETYRQTFSAVASDRSEETLTRVQKVPSSAAGMSAQWEASRGAHSLLLGAEGRMVSGASNELSGPIGAFLSEAGGRQATGAAFVQDRFTASRWTVTVALRFDAWNNFDAFRRSGPRGGPLEEPPVASRSESSWSPRAGFVYEASPILALTASVYRSFRAPTLNELYRDFRVGDTLTLSNPDLDAETLVGGEAGVRVSPAPGAAARLNLFWSEIDDAVTNRTLETTPSLIIRQRQNVGRSRARGAELDFEIRLGSRAQVSGGYMYVDSRILSSDSSASSPGLEGNRVPQVPRHQAILRFQGAFGRARFGLVGRYGAAQYEDDLNTLRLPGFTAIDAQAAYGLSSDLEVFVAGENLTDRRIVTGKTPLTTLGPSRQFRGGVRLRLGP